MKKRTASPCPTQQETVAGLFYLAFQMLLLPSLLYFVNGQLAHPLSESELNFLYYLTNFIAMLVIFHDFLSHSLSQALQHPIVLCEAVILGFVAYQSLFWLADNLVSLLVPGYSNYNQESIADMSRSNSFLMFIGTVILVPPVEECFYRGVIFRNLYKTSHLAAYLISTLVFASIHIIGYLGQYSALELLMALLQYLPAGLCLGWSYIRGDSILAPVLIHAAVNYFTFRNL